MLLCGFASYMTHIGANNVVVKQFSKPLAAIKSPYVLLVAAYIVACLMSLAVSSATGLGVLLMATLFPMMTAMGISRPAAVAVVLRLRQSSFHQRLVMWLLQLKNQECLLMCLPFKRYFQFLFVQSS